MDQAELSEELAELRAALQRLRLDVAQATSLRRQLEAAQHQLRRAHESIERRDVILREAKRRITALSKDLDNARKQTDAAKEALADARGGLWFALRAAVRWAGKRPWRWLGIPFKVLAHRRPQGPARTASPTDPREAPSSPAASRPRTPRTPRSLRVAAIVGSDLAASLEPECTLIQFGSGDAVAVLEDAAPHLLLVESDPYANGGGWQGTLAREGGPGSLQRLGEVVSWCRAREIPTLFWNTLDPGQFESWLPAASLFDHVLTVDGDSVARYEGRGALTLANISELPAGVQPRTFRPTSIERAARACFVVTSEHRADARAWEETRALLDAVQAERLDVYTMPGVADLDGLPDGQLLREPLSTLYRRYAIALNGPAAGDTKRKLPRRVLEMLASGAAVVSLATPDVGLHLGSVVTTVSRPSDAPTVMRALLDDGEMRERTARNGVAFVLREHTVTHRLASMAETAGLYVDAEAGRRVTALVIADQIADAETSLQLLAGQSHSPDEILLGTKAHGAEIEQASGASAVRVRIIRQEGDAKPERLAELALAAATPWVYLAANHPVDTGNLESLILAAPYVDADIIGFSPTDGAGNYKGDIDVNVAVAAARLVAERGWPDDADTIHRWALDGIRVFGVERPG